MDLWSITLVVSQWVQVTNASNHSSKASWIVLFNIMHWEELVYIWLHPLLRRNRITPKCVEDLVFVHFNLWLLSRRREEYTKGKSMKWDIGGDTWVEPFGGPRLLKIANLTLYELEMKISLVENDDYGDDDDVVVLWSSWKFKAWFSFIFLVWCSILVYLNFWFVL